MFDILFEICTYCKGLHSLNLHPHNFFEYCAPEMAHK